MKLKSNGIEQIKLLDYILPPLPDGRFEAVFSQNIEIENTSAQSYEKKVPFYVAGRAFTMPPDFVFSSWPHENAEGNFSNEIPFIVLNVKTFPWQYSFGDPPKKPWVALIVLAANEGAIEKDISIRELLESKPGVFFPSDKQPAIFAESLDYICHVVDIPKAVFDSIMPRPEETPWLCHGRYVNLANTAEDVSIKDGYFSVVMGNRFIPSDETEAKKSTVHLVSLLGYENVGDMEIVRLCSLYRWDVFSQSSSKPGFGELAQHIHCREIGIEDAVNDLRKRGVVAKEHRLRTGEMTASLYCSPLIPEKTSVFDMSSRRTADGRLIYDKNKAVFDATYACAWQLGRMLSLSNESIALQILRWRRGLAVSEHRLLLRANLALPDFAEICKNMGSALGVEEDSE